LKHWWLWLIALLVCLPLAAQSDGQQDDDERILLFDSRITVNDDGSMMVQETIQIRSTGEKIRHGIYRDFLTRYQDRLGRRYSVEFDVVSVQRDGRQESYHTDDLRDGVRVYFGAANYQLPPAKHTYVFIYRTKREIGFFSDHDELYWSVTGNLWKFPIDEATATVILPPRVRNLVTALDAYTGYAGEKGKDFTATRDPESNPAFRAANLAIGQGLSIIVTWPKGLIQEPTAQQKLQQFVSDNRGIVVGLAGLALVFLYFLVAWSLVGRDPAPGTIVPLYEPQDNLSPAGMRYLERMGFDGKTFTAAILGLAAKGYLTIQQDKHNYSLIRNKGYGPIEATLTPDEKTLTRKLFEEGSTVHLTEHNSLLQSAQKALQATLKAAEEKTYFRTNRGYLIPGVVLTAITVAGMVLMAGGAAVGIFMSIWLTGWSAGVSVLMINVLHAWRSIYAGAGAAFGAVFITLFSLPFLAGEIFGIVMLWRSVGALPVVIIFLGIGVNVLFHYLLKAPTRAGRQLMDRVEGFRMFLKAVDGDRMNRMSAPPDKTPELFERFLPYALALGVQHAWAEQFSQVLAAAAGASSQSNSRYSPSWYSGSGISAFSASDFTSSFSDSFSSAVASSSSPAPSSSSGSGGGGSSGGGGGGGGGGGW
jgi:hypothetical protein